MSPSMLLLAAVVAASAGGPPEAENLAATVARARTALLGLEALWGIDGREVEWVLAGDDGAWSTAREEGHEVFVPVELPPGTLRANTAVELGGRRLAMILLPLDGDEQRRIALLVHEAVHTFQPGRMPGGAGTEARGPGGDLLDREDGRTWLFLELRALAAALGAAGEPRRVAAWDALRFRARRDALATSTERVRQDVLDLSEGLPEYTGLRLAGVRTEEVVASLRGAAGLDTSWVRRVGYFTGPGYGYLLDAVAGDGWRARAREHARLPGLLEAAVGAPPPATLEARGGLYGLPELRRAERARARERERRLAELRERFVRGPVLRIVPGALQLVFDPRMQIPLGEAGTYMGGVSWSSSDGAALSAPSGALVSPRWDFLQLPLGKARIAAGVVSDTRTIAGEGWTLTIPAGWRIAWAGTRVELRPPP